MEITLIKTMGGLRPHTDEDVAKSLKWKVGTILRCSVTQMRNGQFHRKWFALVKIAFDAWSETAQTQEYKGIPVLPDFDRFRKDVTVLCGFYKPVFDVQGGLHLEPESISFANMDQERFEQLYSATIDVILQKILPNRGYSEKQLRELVDQVVQFA